LGFSMTKDVYVFLISSIPAAYSTWFDYAYGICWRKQIIELLIT
jgi:hypothetical protein